MATRQEGQYVFGEHPASMTEEDVSYVDVLLVGAGFGSFTVLNKLRKMGLSVKIYEKGWASGGVWYWNCYPGARVDSEAPIYQLFERELYEDFTFRERYSAWPEIRRYFQHVEKKWEISKHVTYNKCVDTAIFDEKKHLWWVECSDETAIRCRWFIPCLGFASKHYRPPFPGLGNFKGETYHSGMWPHHDVSLKNKRIAQIGTGASGIQIAQEIGSKVKHLTLYQRTPNLCLPMKQAKLDPEEEDRKKENGEYDKIFEACRHTFTGFPYTFVEKKTFDDSPEERRKFQEWMFNERGGFMFLLNNYIDMLFDEKANDEAYKFWRENVLKRVKDPEKARILAPEKKPHPFGTKRNSLEQTFYEVMDMDHIDLIDVNENPIEEVTETGLRTKKGLVEVDVLILATGFDSVTGSLAQLNIRGTDDDTIAEHWADGTRTSMGIAMNKFPNMFFLYGPQAPTAFANGPSCTQFQAEWIEHTLKKCIDEGITRLEATEQAEEDWLKEMRAKWEITLYPKANGWYNGANIPGKKIEPYNYTGGMVPYLKQLYDSVDDNFKGWTPAKVGA